MERFRIVEKNRVEQMADYAQYGTYGLRVLFVAPPISPLFSNSSLISDLAAFIDSGTRLAIYSSFLGKNLFAERCGVFMDLSGIILLFGSLLILYYGYESFRCREYMKFLSSLIPPGKIFYSIILSRIALSAISFSMINLFSLLVLKLNGITLSEVEYSHFAVYLLVMLLMLMFFLIAGSIISCIKSKMAAVVTMFAVWFSLVFLVPGIFQNIVTQKANHIATNFKIEMDKLNIQMSNTNRDSETRAINKLEKARRDEIEHKIKIYYSISTLSPVTFYLSLNNEIGGLGYTSFLEFYDYVHNIQNEFRRSYTTKASASTGKKVETFTERDENIFHSHSYLAGNFSNGFIITILYAGGLLGVSRWHFNRFLFRFSNKNYRELADLEMELMRGKTVVLLTGDDIIGSQLYNYFCGHARGFEGEVMLDAEDTVPATRKNIFIYLCHPRELPGNIKVGDFIRFLCRLNRISRTDRAKLYIALSLEMVGKKTFAELKDDEKGRILLSVARLEPRTIHIIHDFVGGMPVDFVLEFIEFLRCLKHDRKAILYITRDVLFAAKIADRLTYLLTDPTLPKHIDTYQAM